MAFGSEVQAAKENTFLDLGTGAWSGWAALAYKVGAGPFALYAGVRLDTGITQRDLGNRERGSFVLQPEFQVTPRLAAFLATGVAAVTPRNRIFLSGAAAVPVSAGVLWEVLRTTTIRGIDVGATYGFADLLGRYGTAWGRTGDLVLRLRL
jgi:hypothetical protein